MHKLHGIFTLNMIKETKSKVQKPKNKKAVRYVDDKRIAKLQAIKANLEQGQHVQNRTLQTWLTKEEFEAIDADWIAELQRREDMYGKKPAAIAEYEERLNKAILLNNRAEGYDRKGNRKAAERLRNSFDSSLEDLLEWLSESYYEDKSIQLWFDRDISDAMAIGANIDLEVMPRIVTSRSLSNERGIRKRTIAEIKLNAVNSALDILLRPKTTNSSTLSQGKELERLLNLPFDDDSI